MTRVSEEEVPAVRGQPQGRFSGSPYGRIETRVVDDRWHLRHELGFPACEPLYTKSAPVCPVYKITDRAV